MHIPVLLDEVIKYLDPKQNENFIDATFGEGGHAAALLKKNAPRGKVLGIEADTELYEKFKSKTAEFPISLPTGDVPKRHNFQFPNRFILVNDSYTNLKRIVKENNFGPVNGILFDLGMSSWHLDESGRGFSFLRDEPLIMRYAYKIQNPCLPVRQAKSKIQNDLTAEKIVNQWKEDELARIFQEYGEERWSKRITRRIVEERKNKPIKTTFELVDIVKKAVPKGYGHGRLHPATRVFQALRIAVNNELENLKTGLSQALEILAPAGRIVVISFHSGEDRIVKNFFRDEAKKGILEILTKKPVTSATEEIKRNPRARSAKLRAAKKI